MLRVGTVFVPLRGVFKLNPGSYFRPVPYDDRSAAAACVLPPLVRVTWESERAGIILMRGTLLVTRAITDRCAYTITHPDPRSSSGSSILTRPSVGRS